MTPVVTIACNPPLGGFAFCVFTAANLIPRAPTNHRWYRATFPDYPANRGTIIPGEF